MKERIEWHDTVRGFLVYFIIAGVPFGFFIGLYFLIMYGFRLGVVAGIASGTLFGLIVTIFVVSQSSKFRGALPLEKDERLIKEGGANHFIYKQSIGGWLYLTNKSIAFRCHAINFIREDLTISLDQIKDVKAHFAVEFIPNGLVLETYAGKERFVVFGAKKWVNEIIKARDRKER